MTKPGTRSGSLAAAFANTGWLLTSSGVSALLSILYLAILTRTLGLAGFGQFALVTGIAGAVAAIVGFQTTQIVLRYGTEHLHHGRSEQLRSLLKACIALDITAGLVGVLLAWLAIAAMGPAFGWSADAQRMALGYCAAILLAVRSTPVGIVRLYDRFAAGAAADTVLPAVRLIGAAAAAVIAPDLLSFLIVWGASEVATAALYWLIALRCTRDLKLGRSLPSLGAVRSENPGILSFAGVTNGNRTLLLGSQQLPVLLIGLFASPAAAGGYRIAHQLGRAIARLPQLFARALFPELMRVQTAGSADQFAPMLRRVLALAVTGGLAMLLLLYFAGEAMLALIAGREFVSAYPLLLLLGAAGVIEMLSVGFEPALMASGHAGQAFRIQLAVALVLVAMLVGFVAWFGPIGAAAAILASAVLRFGLMAIAVARAIRHRDPVQPLPADISQGTEG